MHLTLNLQKLTEYGHEVLGAPGLLWRLEVAKLTGGFVSNHVYRHNLTFRLAEDQVRTVSLVQKYTSAAEVRVMTALGQLPQAAALPCVIDSAADGETPDDAEMTNWFVTPFYEGDSLSFGDEIPTPVIESLAQVHVHFAARLKQFDGLPGLYHVDGVFFRRTLTNALDALAKVSQTQAQPGIAHLQKELAAANVLPIFEARLAKLPVTLVHGDVHHGNILRSPNGKSVLIDWGNARIAPAMLDLANVVPIDSANWISYLSAREQAGGEALAPDLLRQGYDWAVAMVNLQYLPYATQFLPEKVASMIERILAAKDRLMMAA